MNASLVATDACAWPVILRLDADTLGLVHFNRPSHGLEEGDLLVLASRDGGVTWESRGVAAPRPAGGNRMHIATGVDASGNWIVLSTGFQVREGQLKELERVWCSHTSVASATASNAETPNVWSVNREPTLTGVPERVIPHGRIVACADGSLAATFYRSEGRGNPSRAWFCRSEDGGHSWKARGEIGTGDVNEIVLLAPRAPNGNPPAPTAEMAKPGGSEWLAVARTHMAHQIELYASSDDGVSWQLRGPLTLPLQHPADLTDLGDDRLLLTYGIRNRGLMAIGARLSKSGGRTWGAPVVLYQFGEATDCGYPSTVIVKGSEMLTACYSDLSPLHKGYHLLTLRWKMEDWFEPKPLNAISDGRKLEA